MPVPLDRLERLLDSADVGVWQLDVPTGVVTANDVFPRLLQAPAEDLREGFASWEHRIHPADRDRVLDARRRLIAGDIDSYAVDYRVRRNIGGWAPLRARVVVMDRDALGQALCVCGLLTDISRERALAACRT